MRLRIRLALCVNVRCLLASEYSGSARLFLKTSRQIHRPATQPPNFFVRGARRSRAGLAKGKFAFGLYCQIKVRRIHVPGFHKASSQFVGEHSNARVT
jgi:hypothetical protein